MADLKMNRFLITGGAGFIGHHFVEAVLKNTDAEIVILDRLDLSGNCNRITDIEVFAANRHRIKFVYHDLKSPISDIISAMIGKVDYIVHFAASTHVDRSITDPMSFVMDNVVGTTNLLNYARDNSESIKLTVSFSTDEVFGPALNGYNYKESDAKHPKNPYAAAKLGQEAMSEAFSHTYKMPVVVVHGMNVFGERQHPEKYIPSTIRKVIKGELVTVHADSTRTKAGSRYYIHARNVSDAVLHIIGRHNHDGFDEFNVVGEKEVDNLELAQLIASLLRRQLKYELVDFHSSRPGHDLRYGLDGSKMKSLGWTPTKSFEESLEKTICWYLDNPVWLGMSAL